MARITVEDCLQHEQNRFALVMLSSKRTKQLLGGATFLVEGKKGNKSVVNSLREIADGCVRFKTEEDLEREREEARKQREAELALAEEAQAHNGNGNGSGVSVEATASETNSSAEVIESEKIEDTQNADASEKGSEEDLEVEGDTESAAEEASSDTPEDDSEEKSEA